MRILTTLIGMALVVQAVARPSIDTSLPYEIADPEWTIETYPGGPNITVTGTIQHLVARLAEANPNWKSDFAFDPKSEISTELEKRKFDDRTPGICKTPKLWSWADAVHTLDGIRYLNGINGNGKAHLGPGPRNCSRVSCSYGAAIFWCNDNKVAINIGWWQVAQGAQIIYDKCYKVEDGNRFTKGHVYTDKGWNVIVRFDESDSC